MFDFLGAQKSIQIRMRTEVLDKNVDCMTINTCRISIFESDNYVFILFHLYQYINALANTR